MLATKEPQPRFSPFEDETLIVLVGRNDMIYDATSKNYKNAALKEKTWQQIATKLNKTVEHCKTRWRSIRDHYRKQKKFDNGTESSAAKTKRQAYWTHLSFLDAVKNEKESKTKVENTDGDNNSPRDIEYDEGETSNSYHKLELAATSASTPIINRASSSSVPATSRSETKGSDKKRKNKMLFLGLQNKDRSSFNPKQLKVRLNQASAVDEVDLFFQTMAATVKKFPMHSRTSMKLKISQMVFQEEMRLSEADVQPNTFRAINYAPSPTFTETSQSRPSSAELQNE